MNRDQLKEELFTSVQCVQTVGGGPEPALNEGTKPYKDLPLFDSLRLLEVEALLENRIGLDLDLRQIVTSVRELDEITLGELVDLILDHQTRRGRSHD